jgi:citronellol/citronellal dehydrogenase
LSRLDPQSLADKMAEAEGGGMSLAGKTLFITGGSRGIGLAIALRAARDGANIAIAAKTVTPDPRLPGTIHSAAAEIERAGGKALAIPCDIRFEDQVTAAAQACAARFGGIDICVNNASAISLTGTEATAMKRFDLMHQVNARGTFLVSKCCIPFLRKSANPHVVTLSPPLDMRAKWFAPHTAYSMAKYGMSLCVLGMAAEFAGDGIAFNALWPRTAIATAAIRNALAGEEGIGHCRTPEIVADAAWHLFQKPAREFTGHFLIDDTFLAANGVTDFDRYRVDPSKELIADFFVPDEARPPPGVTLAPVG